MYLCTSVPVTVPVTIDEVNNNWKKPEWQEKQYKMKMREGINKTEAQYVLTEKARHELKKLEAESTEKLKRALKDWPDEFKKIQHEIMEVFIFFDRELKRIQKTLEKKEKHNEEVNNE